MSQFITSSDLHSKYNYGRSCMSKFHTNMETINTHHTSCITHWALKEIGPWAVWVCDYQLTFCKIVPLTFCTHGPSLRTWLELWMHPKTNPWWLWLVLINTLSKALLHGMPDKDQNYVSVLSSPTYLSGRRQVAASHNEYYWVEWKNLDLSRLFPDTGTRI